MAEENKNQTILITKPGILAWGRGLPPGPSIQSFFSGETVVQVACGIDHSVVVCESGKVFTFGKNQDTDTVTKPRLVATLATIRVTQAACECQYTVFLTDKGELYSCGVNNYGQLGLGHTNKTPSPVLVTGLPPIKKVAAGYYHTAALADSGEVWVTGSNTNGKLGHGRTGVYRVSFTSVPNLPKPIIDISCGWDHTTLLSASRVLLMAGSNRDGQLGLGAVDLLTSFKPVSVPSVPSSAIEAMCSGSHHVVALGVDGTIWSWGSSRFGQCGNGDENERLVPTKMIGLENHTICEVIAGRSHTALLTEQGDVLVCGRGHDGELIQGKKDLMVATLLPKSPGLVVKQVAFAETYSLILVGHELYISPTPELQCGATLQNDPAKNCVTDLERSIMRSLVCPVCFKIMCAPINQCSNGHSLCNACQSHSDITVCPLCQQHFINARNIALENLSADIQLPCIECLRRMAAFQLERHGEVCLKRKYSCPVQQSCGWQGQYGTMLAHTSSAHPDQTWRDLPHLFLYSTLDDLVHTDVLSAHNQVFTLHRRYNTTPGEFKAAVRYIGPPENKDKFKLEFKFMTDDVDTTFRRNICADVESAEDAFKSPNCVVMKMESVKPLLQQGPLVCQAGILKVNTAKRIKLFLSE